MKDPVFRIVKDFLSIHFQEGKPLLLGFSGGPDSLALLHLLLECRRFFNIQIEVAHVDHGWRKESRQEADILANHVQSLGLRFHRNRLKGIPAKENFARQARLNFFQKLYNQYDCQALLLGHHRDDQSETVLKRILEGASLTSLGSMRTAAQVCGMNIWRPLLKVPKEKLKQWVLKKGLQPIEDHTNLDPRYLRGKMRKTILPLLTQEFGKQIADNLCRLGETAQELEKYLDKQLQKFKLQEDEKKIWVDFPLEADPFETLAFIKRVTEQNKIFLSYEALQILNNLLQKKGGKGRVGSGEKWVQIRGRSLEIKKE